MYTYLIIIYIFTCIIHLHLTCQDLRNEIVNRQGMTDLCHIKLYQVSTCPWGSEVVKLMGNPR